MSSFLFLIRRLEYFIKYIKTDTVRPKTLQMLLGHSKLSMTMDLYVHVTDDEKKKEIEKIEDMLIVV